MEVDNNNPIWKTVINNLVLKWEVMLKDSVRGTVAFNENISQRAD